MNKDITLRSSNGKWVSRVIEYRTFHPPYWMYCSGCSRTRVEGLGGQLAMTHEDLCVGAMVDGWKFTTTQQHCPQCRGNLFYKLLVWFNNYSEWILRLVGGRLGWGAAVFALSIFVGSQVLAHGLVFLITHLSAH